MNISIVIPLFNEEESLPELTRWIQRVMTDNGFSYEIIFVNDGSTDRSQDVVHTLAAADPNILHFFRPQLRKVAGAQRGVPQGSGRCGDHYGCRPAGFAG